MSETRLPLPLNQEKKNQACRKEIQHNHDVPFIHPIRNQAADGRHDNKRKERYAGYHTQKRRRSGNRKQVQRKGKADDRISEQGNDLTDYNEIKILGKSFFHINLQTKLSAHKIRCAGKCIHAAKTLAAAAGIYSSSPVSKTNCTSAALRQVYRTSIRETLRERLR
jgi:hypothetical protein